MDISREQYEAVIRKAKAEALRDAAHDAEARQPEDDAWRIADGIRAHADKLDPQ